MGMVTGLKALQEIQERASGTTSERKQIPWFKLGDRESARIKFLQEFDPASAGYDEKFGLCGVLLEHSSAVDWKRKAKCSTEDHGECVGCEMYSLTGDKAWKGKLRFYANVVVIPDNGPPEVKVISQGVGRGSIYPSLLEFYNDNGPITPHTFRIKRSGADFNNTSYTLSPLLQTIDIDTSGLEIFDIETEVGLDIPYERQRNFYLVDQISAPVPGESLADAHDDEWT